MSRGSGNYSTGGGTVATVTTSLTDVIEINVTEAETLGIQVVNADVALNAFQTQGAFTPDGSYQAILSAAGDYTSPAEPLIAASGDLTALGIATGWLMLNVKHLAKVRIQASVAAGTSGVTPTYILKG